MGTMWAKSGSYEFDSNGDAADGALAYFYQAGTSTPFTVYSDGAETTPHEDPVEADGNGRWPLVFVPYVATYKFVLKTAAGSTLFTADNVPNPEPFDETFEVDEDAQYQTGDYIFIGKNGTRSGAVRCNSRTIGDASSGATERANADTADLFAYLWNNYANGQAAVSTGRGASAAADFAAHKTIALPDHRGAIIVGFDDMGNSAASLLGSAPVVSGSAILAGSILGANTHTLSTGEAPAHTHTFSATTSSDNAHTHALSSGSVSTNNTGAHTHAGTAASDGAHTHGITGGTLGGTAAGGENTITGSNPVPIGATAIAVASDGAHTHTIATTSDGNHIHTVSGTTDSVAAHTHTVSGTSGSTGGGGAHNNVSRGIPVTVLMKL